MYNFLEDENELKRFFDFYISFVTLKPTECLFLSLAARNKYMQDRETNDINLNKTHMFDRQIVVGKDSHRLWNNLITSIRKLERNIGAYKVKSKTSDGVLYDIPNECMMVYFNINPANSVNALLQLKDRINKIEEELWKASVEGNSIENCIMDVNRIHHIAEECYGKAKSKRRWFDVDIDFKSIDNLPADEKMKEIAIEICDELNILHNSMFLVRTYGGFHLCFNVNMCKTLKKSPQQILDVIRNKVESYVNKYNTSGTVPPDSMVINEIKLNENEIIPLPGTRQSTHLVRFIQVGENCSEAQQIFENNIDSIGVNSKSSYKDLYERNKILNKDSYKEAMEKGYLPFEKTAEFLAKQLGEDPEVIRQWMLKQKLCILQ